MRRKLEVGVTDLATTHPELAAQWDYERNGQLTPRDVLYGSGLEVHWKQNYIVPDDYPVELLKGTEIVFTQIHQESPVIYCGDELDF